ncbi:MAG TPA: hypothetical protein VE174_03570 [Actinomycetota bacterium]|nr:hypothetical protein [Actinomycetota bacterium]
MGADTPAVAPSLFEIVGGVAAAVAIAGSLFGLGRAAYRRFRRRQFLGRLRGHVTRIRELDELVRSATWDMELLFSKGLPWRGYAIFSDELGDHLNTLQRVAGDTADVVAEIRALDALGADERLRQDVEGLAEGLRRVVPLYIWGIVASYRKAYSISQSIRHPGNDGEEEDDETSIGAKGDEEDLDEEESDDDWKPMMVWIPPSATGREPARTLRTEDRARVRDLRLDLRVLYRSVTLRLGMPDIRDKRFAAWPLDMVDAYKGEAKLRSKLVIPYEH